MADSELGSGRRGGKSAAAFRTISEVAGDLDVPPHVLRFWETKFSQVKPLKRGGGGVYRPEDVHCCVFAMLYGEGYTIKGVQRLLRDGWSNRRHRRRRRRPAAPPAPPPPPRRAPTTATALRAILQDLRRMRGSWRRRPEPNFHPRSAGICLVMALSTLSLANGRSVAQSGSALHWG